MSAITASRDEGEAVALAAATTAHSWLPTVTQHLDTAITSGQAFTADTLRMGLPQPARVWCRDHGDAYAALFSQAARAGRIAPTGWTTSRRPTRRGNPIRIWKGTTP